MNEPAIKAKAAQIKRISAGTKRLYAIVNGVVTFIK